MRHSLFAAAFAAAIAITPAGGAAAATANDTIARAAATVSPFSPNGDGYRDTTGVRVSLHHPASVTVTVARFDGTIARHIASGRSLPAGDATFGWDGRDDAGRVEQNAAYRFQVAAVNALGTARTEALVTQASRTIYPTRPGLITIVIDAGHGGQEPGAVYGGVLEKTLNLDIALRLSAMLRGVGVNVVMTRTADVTMNVARADTTGDHVVDRRDDLQVRVDLANTVRADAMVIVMNNASACHCGRGPSTFTNAARPWGTLDTRLATYTHQEHLTLLQRYRSATFTVNDGHVRDGSYHHEMRGYDAAVAPRPSLLPVIMMESLYLDQPPELALLKRADVRQTIAESSYNGIARYLAAREVGLRYTVAAAPTAVATGARLSYSVSVANRARALAAGGSLEVRAVPAVPSYDGSGARGTLLGSVRLPAIAAGATAAVIAAAAAPPPGQWLVKLDVRLPDGTYASDRGVVAVQLPLRVGAAPSPSPTAAPSVTAQPSATAPTPTPSPTVTAPATASAVPSAPATASPTPTASADPAPTAEASQSGSPAPTSSSAEPTLSAAPTP